MHYGWILIIPAIFAAGCASPQPTRQQVSQNLAMPPAFPAARTTRLVETRYSVRGFRELGEPDIRHEAHSVFRQTKVPASFTGELETEPLRAFSTASIAPLAADVELNAELNTQREITEELRDAKDAVTGVQKQMEARYATLVKQSEEVGKLREQLEAESVRLRALKQTQINAPTAAPPVAESTEVRW